MFSPNERVATGILGTALIALLLPLHGSAAEEPAQPSGPTLYQVRCWQYGRLLFEEREVQLPSELPAGLKLRGTDRNRKPVYITDTGNATCLIRSVEAPKR